MKQKVLIWIYTAVLLLSLCGYAAAATTVDSSAREQYDSIISAYQDVFTSNRFQSLSQDEIQNMGLFSLLPDFTEDDVNNFGYTLEDINGDGMPELFLGVNNDEYNESVYQVWTASDGQSGCLYSADEYDAVYLQNDGQLRYEAWDDDGSYVVCLYKLNRDCSVTVTGGVLYDASSSSKPYLSITDDSFDPASGKAISESTFNSRVDDYVAKEKYLHYDPLSSWDNGKTSSRGIGRRRGGTVSQLSATATAAPARSSRNTGNNGAATATAAPARSSLNTGNNGSDTYYTIQTLTDSATGVKFANVLVPYGWNVSSKVDWTYIDATAPGVATVTLTSPDGKASICLESNSHFIDMYNNGIQQAEGPDYSSFLTRVHYRTAEEMQKFYFQAAGQTNYRLIKSYPIPDTLLQTLNEGAKIQMNNMVTSNGVSGIGYEGTGAMNLYQVGNQYMERMTLTTAAHVRANTGHVVMDFISWNIVTNRTLVAESKQAYDKYRDVFIAVNANSSFTSELLYVNVSYGTAISNRISQQRLEYVQQSLKSSLGGWAREYEDSPYYDSSKFTNEWSDVIKEQNDYTTLDGETIKVSTAYDAVYQNGDQFYLGSEGQSPYGWTRLYPN